MHYKPATTATPVVFTSPKPRVVPEPCNWGKRRTAHPRNTCLWPSKHLVLTVNSIPTLIFLAVAGNRNLTRVHACSNRHRHRRRGSPSGGRSARRSVAPFAPARHGGET